MQDYLQQRQNRINQLLARCLPDRARAPQQLHQAMHYAVLKGGKRLRPLLVYAAGETFKAPLEQLDGAACAVELIHAYSLIHDDLPAIDNDDFRRGQPSCHKAFSEAIAILAGDGLQALAFEILAVATDQQPFRQQMITLLAKTCSAMVSGQALELSTPQTAANPTTLETIHQLKTGALIAACVELGALTAQADLAHLQALKQYAACLGLAFQIQDDIQDDKAATSYLNYSHCLGLTAAQNRLQELRGLALKAIEPLDNNAAPLHYLLTYCLGDAPAAA
jgi:geranylgeranyl pyrophosphate synthase